RAGQGRAPGHDNLRLPSGAAGARRGPTHGARGLAPDGRGQRRGHDADRARSARRRNPSNYRLRPIPSSP
nr:hypothetical protein [Tanacetum cinerariifolium]